jgi:transposase
MRSEEAAMKFLVYSPDQAYLLPPSVKDILGEEHLCFFLCRLVKGLDLSVFEQAYEEEGRPGYHPALLVAVWLYAYALGVTSSRRLEQRIREDLAFRYLAGGATPDYWTLNQFRRRHARAINDLFTQVLEAARDAGLGRLGHVAIDSTRVAANASRNRVESEDALRRERAKLRRQVRRWQQACDAADPNETPGTVIDPQAQQAVEARLAEIPRRLEKLRNAGLRKRSRTDPDSRFLRERQGFTLGYTVTVATSEDHLIVAQRVGQEATDNASLLPVVEAVEQRCGETPQRVSADSGFFSLENLRALEARGIEGYVPDANLAHELNARGRRGRAGRLHHPEQRRMRQRLRSPAGRAVYARRKAIIEPVFGVLKEQRGMRRFRLRGLAEVAVEMALAATAYNLTRLWSLQRAQAGG